MKKRDKESKPSILCRLKTWMKKRRHLKMRKRGLLMEVTMLKDGRMILSELVTKTFGLTNSSSVVMHCSDDDCTNLAVTFSPKGDPRGFKVSGGKCGKPYFIRLDKYYSANRVIPPTTDTVCELIDIEQEIDGCKIYRVVDKAAIK